MNASAILARVTPMLARVAIVLGAHLLAVGHDLPGGGFIGALVIGSGVALSILADEPLPRMLARPQLMLGWGLLVVTLVGITPALFGSTALDMTSWTVGLGPLGSYKVTSALFFDLGVALLVVGLIVTVVRAFQPEGRA